jgi:WD40 repeat protein
VKVFTWDTGNSAGECVGHSKRVISCAYKPSRPFRVFTAGEDMRTIFYAGPPFKLDHSNSSHSNFVNCIRYSPNGERAVSVSSDKKIQFYDGKTGVENGEIVNAHGGSIYSVSFSADNNYILTTSADKTVKVWDVATLSLLSTLSAIDPALAQVPDMQVGVVSGGGLGPSLAISLSLSGNLNYYDISAAPGLPPALAPVRVVQGHQVALTALVVDRERGVAYSGSFDGVICATDFSNGGIQTRLSAQDRNTSVCGAVHGGMVSGIAFQRKGESEKEVVSIGWDDSIRRADVGTNICTTSAPTSGQPCSISTCVGGGFEHIVAVATNSHVTILRGEEVWITLTSLSYSPTAVAMWGGVEVAVGGSDNKTHIYAVNGDSLTEVTTLNTRSKVTVVAYNPQGDCLAIGDEGRQVEVYQRDSWEPRITGRWVYHTSRITCLSWSPSGAQLASGSLDENIFIWSLASPNNKLQLPFSHMAGVTGLDWLDVERLVSGGNDHSIVLWKIPPLSA